LAVLAVQHIRKMRGGAQGQMMLGADGHAYVVKFQNNPQHLRVLANELMASKLAEAIGLSAPACDVIEVTRWLTENTLELEMDFGARRERCRPGHCFGSRLVGGLMPGHLLDYLPEEQLAEVRNLEEFAGVLVLDKWTCNTNGRQVVFTRKPREKRYAATFIDFGYCFNAGEWIYRDSPLRGVYARNLVYRGVTGWESFEPWLSRIEALGQDVVWGIAEMVPPEWYEGDANVLEKLIEGLLKRRSRIRELIDEFRESAREPFPNWGKSRVRVRAEQFAQAKWDDELRIGRLT